MKKCVKIREMLFKNLKWLFKNTNQTPPWHLDLTQSQGNYQLVFVAHAYELWFYFSTHFLVTLILWKCHMTFWF